MKKLIILLFILVAGIFNSHCSKEPECDQIDWIGIYQFEDLSSSCTGSQSDNDFPDEMVIEAGSNSKKIIINGTELDFIECTVELSFGFFDIGYGEIIVTQAGCSATYTKE